MKTSDKLVIGVIVCGVAYVCISPFLQMILPASNPLSPAATESAAPPASSSGLDLSDAIMHGKDSAGERDATMQKRFLATTGLDKSEGGDQAKAEALLKELAAQVTSGKKESALKLTDSFLTFLKEHPGLDKRYCVLGNTLGLQTAYEAGLKERAAQYGKAAHNLSRQIDDYMMERIEPTYFKSIGIEADFDGIDSAFAKYDELFAARNLNGLGAVAEDLNNKVVGLPADSFEHLRADMYSAYAGLAGNGDKSKAREKLEQVAQRADTAGDTGIAAKCKAMAAAIAKL